MIEKELSFLTNLKFIPQVTLLSIPKVFFKAGIRIVLKKIVCQDSLCSNNNLCINCQKIKEKRYFDLQWYQCNKNNLLKKQDVASIINNLSHQSIEDNNPRICVIEEIEYSSLEASNTFLKFLENLPNNTFLIFTSENINKVLPTIKSRSQIFSLFSNYINIDENDLGLVKDLITKFINNDNNKEFDNNFFLIKEIIKLKEQIGLFFQFLLELTKNKLIGVDSNNSNQDILENWKNNDQLFLLNLIEVLSNSIDKFNNVKNLNLNLLLNNFFITIYQGQENEF